MDSSLFSPVGIPVCFNFALWVAPPPSKPEFEQKCKQLHGATTVLFLHRYMSNAYVHWQKKTEKNWITCYNSWAWKWLNTNVTNQNRLSHPKDILTWLGPDTCDHNILSMRNSFSRVSFSLRCQFNVKFRPFIVFFCNVIDGNMLRNYNNIKLGLLFVVLLFMINCYMVQFIHGRHLHVFGNLHHVCQPTELA